MANKKDQDKFDEAMQCFHRHHYRANGEHASIQPIPPYDPLIREARQWIEIHGSIKKTRKFFDLTIKTNDLELKLGFIKESKTNIDKCKQMLWILDKSKYEELYKPLKS